MGSPEAAKKRILPSWMTKKVVEPAQWSEMKPKKRKKVALVRTDTVYCMNEAELVNMALFILAEKCKAMEGKVIASTEEVKEPQQDHYSSRSASSRIRESPLPLVPSDESTALNCSEKTKLEEADDALKYVREIFFS